MNSSSARVRTDIARLVTSAWSEAVGIDRFGSADDFFALGGDSVSAATVARRVSQAGDLHIPPRSLFDHPRFADFIAFAATCGDQGATPEPRPGLAGINSREPDPAAYPLTPGQERLWLLSRLHPERASYTVATIVALAGPVDLPALSAALRILIERHEPLRTVIDDSPSEPVCRIMAPEMAAELAAVSIRECTDENDAREQATTFLSAPFNLRAEPPIRIRLLRLSPASHWLVLALHHIATDSDSEQILLDELGLAYNAALAGSPPALPPLALTYSGVTAWHARSTAARPISDYDRQIGRLRGLADWPFALEATGTGPVSGLGSRYTRWLGGPLTAAVRKQARASRSTVFVTLLAVFADIAARWSGSDDVCLGYPVSRRDLPGTRQIVGFFVDTCAVRVDLSGRPALGTLIGQVHADVRDGIEDEVPFDILAGAAAAERGDRTPLFRAWFNYLGTPAQPPRMDRLVTSIVDIPAPPALFDINIYVTDHGTDIRVDLVYDTAACSADAADELLSQYLDLLKHAIADAGQPLRQHRCHTSRCDRLPDPRDPLLAVEPPSLGRRLARVSRARRQVIAIKGADHELTYGELRTAVRTVATAVRSCGAPPGATVAVHLARGPDVVIAMLAVLAAGSRLLMLDPNYPPPRLSRYLVAAHATCMIAHPGPLPDLPDGGLIRLRQGAPVIERFVSGNGAPGEHESGRPEPAASSPGRYLAFTSGTTGEPVRVSAGIKPVAHFLRWYSAEYHLSPRDRFALLAGLSHDPFFRDSLLPLWNGATLCVPGMDTYADPAELAAWLREEHVTVANLTPALTRLLTETGIHLPALRLICLAGDALAPSDLTCLNAMAPRAVLVNGYGTTETPQLASRLTLGGTVRPALGPTAPGSQLLIIDPHGRQCGIGEAGAIVVRSRYLAERVISTGVPGSGDDRSPTGLTADPVPGVARFRTGDRGRYQTDGTVDFLGREDDMVSIRGFRVHPAETDRTLAAVPGVSASVTVGRAGPDGMELISYVAGADVNPAALGAHLAATLPPAFRPSRIVRLDRLPITGNGKIDKTSLPEAALADPAPPKVIRPDPGQPGTPYGNSMEGRLTRICSAVFGLPDIDVNATFFELGGTSLKLLRMHNAIRRELGLSLPLLALYQHPTVRSLARSLSHSTPADTPAITARASRAGERSRRLAARASQPVTEGGRDD